MRLAFLENSPVMGGGQQNLLTLLSRLDRSRFEPFVICHKEGPFTERARALAVPLSLFDMGRLRQRFLWEFAPRRRKLSLWFEENRIQMVVANSFPAGKLGIPAAQDAGIPAILYKQIIIHKGYFSSTAAVYRFYLNRCDRIVAVSEACRKGLLAIGISGEKVKVIPNGIDTNQWRPGHAGQCIRERFGIGDRALLAGNVSALRPEKGIAGLLKAWAGVVKAEPRAILAIIGEADPGQRTYGEELKKLSRALGLSSSVIFCGCVEDLRPAFSSFDLYISSSLSEAFGLSLAMAMACGKPVISTRSGGPEEIIENGVSGCLVSQGSDRSLADAILSLLRDHEKRARIGQAARRRIEERFSLERQIAGWEKTFAEVASLR